jgi:hypothetical protein
MRELLRGNRLETRQSGGNHTGEITSGAADEQKIRRYVRYQEHNERLEEKEREETGFF